MASGEGSALNLALWPDRALPAVYVHAILGRCEGHQGRGSSSLSDKCDVLQPVKGCGYALG